MSATVTDTITTTRNRFAKIMDRLNDITHSELEKSAPLGRETRKSDFINYYNAINSNYKF